MRQSRVDHLAGKPEWYPNPDALVDECARSFGHPHPVAMKAVEAVFAGLARADIQGLISVGDAHEWAAVSVRAAQIARGET